MIKYIPIDQIVHTISITHKFNKEKLYAINTSDVLEGEILNAPLMNVSELKGQFKKTIENGDLLFSEIRPANRRYAKVRIEDTRDYVVSTKLMVLRKYNNDVDFDYFYYCLTNQWFLNILQKRAENRICSFPQITFELLSEYKFRIPELDEQKKIAKILLLLDKKISLNTRMNAELETMAKQLYDYWFVQFDFPDENGKPYKSSGGKMVYNEKIKREIPEGWGVQKLEEIVSLLRDGTHNPPKRVESGIPLLTGTMFGKFFIDHSLATYITEVDYNNIHKQYKPQSGDIILTKIGTIGNVNYLRNKDIPLAIHCNSALLRFPSSMGKSFPFFLCKSQLFSLRLKAMKGQSVQEFVSLDKIGSVRMEIPNNELISLFNQKVDKIFDEITNLSEEIESLSHLRDSLLPMLMNGQVTVE